MGASDLQPTKDVLPGRRIDLRILRSATATAAAVVALFCAAPASAAAFIQVSAGYEDHLANEFFRSADNFGGSPSSGLLALHALAVSDPGGGLAYVMADPKPGCGADPVGFGCAASGALAGGPGGFSAVEVRGDLGLVRMQSFASADLGGDVGSAFGSATVDLIDALRTSSAGTVTIHLHLDGDLFESPGGGNIAEDVFTLTLDLTDLSGSGFNIPQFSFGPDGQQSSHFVVDQDFVLADLPADALIGLELTMEANDACVKNDPGTCAVFLNAGHTAYIGVEGDVTSQSGYAYPGFQGAAAVPEPATWGMLVLGLFGLGAARRRARAISSVAKEAA